LKDSNEERNEKKSESAIDRLLNKSQERFAAKKDLKIAQKYESNECEHNLEINVGKDTNRIEARSYIQAPVVV